MLLVSHQNRNDRGVAQVELALVLGFVVFLALISWNILMLARTYHAVHGAVVRAGESLYSSVGLDLGTYQALSTGQSCSTSGWSQAHFLLQERIREELQSSLRQISTSNICITTTATVSSGVRHTDVTLNVRNFSLFALPFFNSVQATYSSDR